MHRKHVDGQEVIFQVVLQKTQNRRRRRKKEKFQRETHPKWCFRDVLLYLGGLIPLGPYFLVSTETPFFLP